MSLFQKLISLFIFSIVPAISIAEPVDIIGIDIPGLHQQDGKGVYDQILQKTVIKSGKATLTIYPPARAEKSFESCQNCCYSPANTNPEFYNYGETVKETEPMNVAKIYIFSAPGSQALSGLDSLTGKIVGTRRGMIYGKSFESKNLKLREANSLAQNIKKIETGRIDVMVAYIPDAYLTFQELNQSPFPHDQDKPIAIHKDALICRGVDESFIDKFNQSLVDLRNSGSLKEILGESYLN